MELEPKGKWIVGRVVDIEQSKGGLTLATSEIKNVTVFLLVDKVGPDVKNAKVNDVILYKAMNHVFLRDGTHYAVVLDDEDNVIAQVTNLDMGRVAIEGQKKVDGSPADGPRPTPAPPLD